MNKILEFYLIFGIYTIPITIAFLIYLIREILEFVINKEKVKKLIIKAESISFENIEHNISIYSNKLKTLDEWTLKELEIINKNRELNERVKKAYRKRESDAIYWEKEDLKKYSLEIINKYWISKWKPQKTQKEINQELKFRKLFSPD